MLFYLICYICFHLIQSNTIYKMCCLISVNSSDSCNVNKDTCILLKAWAIYVPQVFIIHLQHWSEGLLVALFCQFRQGSHADGFASVFEWIWKRSYGRYVLSGLQVHKRWKTGREIVSDSQSSDGRSMQQVSQSFQRIIDQLVQQHLAEITEIAHIHFPQDRGNNQQVRK